MAIVATPADVLRAVEEGNGGHLIRMFGNSNYRSDNGIGVATIRGWLDYQGFAKLAPSRCPTHLTPKGIAALSRGCV